jgi:hypothetical protein
VEHIEVMSENGPPKGFDAMLVAMLQLGVLERDLSGALRNGSRPLRMSAKYRNTSFDDLPAKLLRQIRKLRNKLEREHTQDELVQMIDAVQ